jgi:ketosteroid isomerase-like protein
MSEVSIHPASTARFIDRLHGAFLDGDDAAAAKDTEAENVRRLQEQYRALARGDFEPAIALMADDIELELNMPAEMPFAGTWRGLEAVVSAMQQNFGSLADQHAELHSVVAQGDTVALFAEERGRVRATGVDYHIKWVQLFTFRDGKIVHIRGVAAPLAGGEG